MNKVVFIKNTIFKSKIIARSETDMKAYFKEWYEKVEQEGYTKP